MKLAPGLLVAGLVVFVLFNMLLGFLLLVGSAIAYGLERPADSRDES